MFHLLRGRSFEFPERLFEEILSLHHSINVYRAAVAGFDRGEYWVMKPGSRDPSIEGVTHLKMYGIKVPNNDNVDVVVPIRLAERPDVAASGSELERTRRYIMECEARAFNAEPDDVRKARFVAHDAATAEADRLWDLAKKAKADNDNAAYVNLLEQKGEADRRRIGVLFLLDRTNFTISPVHLHR